MIKLFAKSQILRHDEVIDVYREDHKTTYLDGRKIKNGDDRHFKVRANVQPVNGRDLLMLPEHDRKREQLWVYAENNLIPGDAELGTFPPGAPRAPGSLELNDRIVRLGVNYQVQSVENWGSFVRARIMSIDVGSNRNK